MILPFCEDFIFTKLKNSRKFPIFQYSIYQGVHGQGKSQGKTYFFKIRELSGNFEIGQGNLKIKQKVSEF